MDYAQHQAISHSDIWIHFMNVMAPVVKQYQAKADHTTGLGQLLLFWAKEILNTSGSIDKVKGTSMNLI